jgi:murein DD-endopeptidase MepM/ murein hydrolase activator NlpD
MPPLGSTATRPRRRGPSYDQLPMEDRFPKKRAAPAADGFSARRALRRSGIRSRQAANRGLLDARHYAGAPGRVAAADPTGVAQLVLYVFTTILALALLENVLGGRGPAAVDKLLAVMGGGIRKLVDPTDPLIGAGPTGTTATGDPAPGAAGTVPSAGGYRNPFAFPFTVGRTDQGLDLEAGASAVGKPIGVLGDAQVIGVDRNYSGYGQYVSYRLLSGPDKGKAIFVGHSRVADVKVGDRLPAGSTIAFVQGYNAQPGHIEIGYADPAHPYETLARARGDVNPSTHFSTEGQAFTAWFLSLFGKGAK